ncbi:ATP phosphoribosyltransferase [Mucilaginibacter rubeus]|uniref:ATP phosphoribosyltransferase n=1 Tax=Mucilaginibacter rubeus TaxID=2027860 RepID=A0AAE6JC18_9SPHI|nr:MULTISPECIES: ATP phosphoribosyltransferase [Mucilaginibacter]QEM02934.1 ATP phosphoribosyltransferase [Mucilaginibacter rubeus]QEM15551.1 ATP phosphoribosyltransferase [Mucilaginibacter gossypii]QTE41716.1 ATP phosphoribosyltransferase [Mucilaginibacter rubeus]QTE48320.1 ATP phosphoribosyltransferase [Mucilaginibacter rubeus]QTE59707.1 ATP phosphoribosyltransferase [Mucilaginibacter rubeus]
MKTLKIAIQKSGRLNEKSVELLKNCGLNFENYKSSLISPVSNFPLEILFLRDDDIPEYVQDGIADLGIVGENVIQETEVEVSYLQRLGFGKCSLKIAVPNNSDINSLADLHGKAIATTYPAILGKFLKQQNINSDIRTISGSVEISPGLGLSDAICDLVSTGGTLKSNGLKPFADVMSSEAVLIGSKAIAESDLVQELIQRIQSVLRAKETKYVVLNVEKKNLDAVIALLPGVKSPSVVPLAEEGWVAVHTVIPERDFWDRISQLKQAGAQGIVVMPIEKIIL